MMGHHLNHNDSLILVRMALIDIDGGVDTKRLPCLDNFERRLQDKSAEFTKNKIAD